MPRSAVRTLPLAGLALAACAAAAAAAAPAARLAYPASPPGEVVETLHDLRVPDPYRWLEELQAPATRQWIAAQDALTRSWLAEREVETLRERLQALVRMESIGVPVARGGRLFHTHTAAGESRQSLLVREGESGAPRVLVAAASLGEDERIVGFWPSHDGRTVALGVARAGSPWYRVRFLSVDGGAADPAVLGGLHASAGTPAWAADDGGLFYGRFAEPQAGREQEAVLERHELRFHRLGTPAGADTLVHSRPDRPELSFTPRTTLDGRHLVVHESRGAAPGNAVLVLDLAGGTVAGSPPRVLAASTDAALTFLHAEGERFLFRTTRGAPRGRVVGIDLAAPAEERWRDVLPEREDALYFANVVAGRIVAVSLRDARHVVEVFSLDGRREREVALPDLGTTFSGFVGMPGDTHAYFSFNGVAYPGAASVFRLDPRSGETAPFHPPALPFSPADYVTRQVFFTSLDGTRVPMFLAHRRDLALDGRAPALLYAYGAFGWPATPWFQPHVLAWMEQGGIYAIANVRGGGEYGEAWHRAGVGANRQNALDDYLAAADWLVANRFTSRDRLVGNGGSASGPLAAAAMLQRPEAFGAMLIDIPVLDLMRFDRFTGGGRWRSELGDPREPRDAARLLAQSPYHNVRAAGCPPPTLLTAGERDETAVPSHAYKFVAALQARQECGSPALLQVVWGGGHGFGSTPAQSAETWARQLAFLRRALALETPAVSVVPRAAF